MKLFKVWINYIKSLFDTYTYWYIIYQWHGKNKKGEELYLENTVYYKTEGPIWTLVRFKMDQEYDLYNHYNYELINIDKVTFYKQMTREQYLHTLKKYVS